MNRIFRFKTHTVVFTSREILLCDPGTKVVVSIPLSGDDFLDNSLRAALLKVMEKLDGTAPEV